MLDMLRQLGGRMTACPRAPVRVIRSQRRMVKHRARREPAPSAAAAGPPSRQPAAFSTCRCERGARPRPPAVRVGVVETLARLHTPETAPLLVTAAHDPAEDVRSAAIDALGGLREVRGREAVEAALDDPSARVRLFAARACAALCSSPGALARLVEIALDDEVPPPTSR